MDALSIRGAFNCFVFGILFGVGFHVAGNIIRLIGTLFR